MPLVSLIPLLRDAQARSYALPGFNIQNLEMLQGVMLAAERERSPVILQFNPANVRHVGLDYASAMAAAANRRASLPIALHLDHGFDLAQATAAVEAGFTSVMYDGTPFPLADNIAVTRMVCGMAHAAGVSVEGEIGQMGGKEEGVFTAAGTGTMTDPDEAEQYVVATGVDALAVAVGNVHGMTQATGTLDLDRLSAIRERVKLPLVIHGGSGLSDGLVQEAISRGVCKFNVATQLNVAFLAAFNEMTAAAPEESNPRAALEAARLAVADAAAARIRVFGATGKA